MPVGIRPEIAPYIEHARKARQGQRRRPVRAASSRERSGDIRAWAKDHGITVSERGRIPASVIEQYGSRHDRGVTQPESRPAGTELAALAPTVRVRQRCAVESR